MNRFYSFILSLILLFTYSTSLNGQGTEKRGYWKSGGELIFSGGEMGKTLLWNDVNPAGAVEVTADPVVRFTAFFHFQNQFHYDFSENLGIYMGIGMRNIGWITKFSSSSVIMSDFRLKQRSYTLGVPLAIKFGDVNNGFYIAVGGEAELFFAYKQKLFINDQKIKSDEWFSKKVNLINASVFLDIVGKEGGYLRFRYYLTDWLADDKQSFAIGTDVYNFVPEKSQMISVSLGTAILTSRYKKAAETQFKSASIY